MRPKAELQSVQSYQFLVRGMIDHLKHVLIASCRK